MKPESGGGDVMMPTGAEDPTVMMNQMAAMFGPFFAVMLLVGLAIAVFSIFCWWKIFSKAGFSGALSLVFLAGIIPLIGPIICLVLFIWFAFADWPVSKRPAQQT